MDCGLEGASTIASKRKLGEVGLSFRWFAQLERIDKKEREREGERERVTHRQSPVYIAIETIAVHVWRVTAVPREWIVSQISTTRRSRKIAID